MPTPLDQRTNPLGAPIPAGAGVAPVGGPDNSSSEEGVATASILIVDDNAQNLELLHAYLEDLGCQTRTARDGVEAMESVRAAPPDLILLDVMMPRMSGFQVCTKLKANPETRDIPIVMVTALNEVGDIERAVDSGADDFLTKPVNRLELVTRVKSLLRVRLLKRQLDRTLGQLHRLRGESRGPD
jgi:two-component system cell cycle response regulator